MSSPPSRKDSRRHLPHPAPEGHLVGALVAAVAVQDKGRDLQVVQVDARLGEHGQKAVGVLGGGHPAQHGGEPDMEMAQHALGDLGPAQPLVVHGGLQPAEGLLKVVDVGGLEQVLGHVAADGHIQVLEIAVSAQDHDLDLGVFPAEPLHQLHPVHPRHPYVGQDHVRPAVLHPVQHLLAAGAHSRHLIAPLPPGQAVGHAVAYIFLVVRNNQTVHRRPPVGPCCFGAGHPKKARQKLAAQTPPLFYIYYTARAARCTSAVFVMGWPVLPVQINISCSRVFSSAVRSAMAVRAAAARHWAGVWPVSFLKTRHR